MRCRKARLRGKGSALVGNMVQRSHRGPVDVGARAAAVMLMSSGGLNDDEDRGDDDLDDVMLEASGG